VSTAEAADSTTPFGRLLALNRLSAGLQEAGDEAKILTLLENGLRQLNLSPWLYQLSESGELHRLLPAAAARGRHPERAAVPPGLAPWVRQRVLARIVDLLETIHAQAGTADWDLLRGLTAPGAVELSFERQVSASVAVAAPTVTQGRASGVLLVFGAHLAAEEAAGYRLLGDQIAIALERARLLSDLKQALLREHAAASELRRLEALVAELSAESQLEGALGRIVNAAADALGSEQVALYLLESDQLSLHLSASVGLSAAYLEQFSRLGAGSGGPLHLAVASGLICTVADLLRQADWPELVALRQSELRSVIAVPLRSSEAESLGVLAVFDRRPIEPSSQRLELVQRYAHHAARAIVSSHRQERATSAARTETLIELARSVPHELGQPLAIISGYAELIAAGYLKDERLAEACAEIVEASHRLADLVQRLERITSYARKDFGAGRSMIDIDRASEQDEDR
jgi:GAF domain-containing protein